MPIVSLKNISKSFKDKVIFKDFSLDVEEGEFLSVSGASGKGKTTLLNIIGLLEKPDSGDVFLFDTRNESFGSKGVLLTITLQAATDITNGNATGTLVTDFTDQEYGSSVLGFVATDNYWTYGFPQASFTVSMTNDTGIHDLQADDAEANTYNLMGQRVQHADKGVFIKNGKKIIKK